MPQRRDYIDELKGLGILLVVTGALTFNVLQRRRAMRKVLQAELDKGEWQPIPVRAVALPPPPVTKEAREAAERTHKIQCCTVESKRH